VAKTLRLNRCDKLNRIARCVVLRLYAAEDIYGKPEKPASNQTKAS
jgi:hypothetical protein